MQISYFSLKFRFRASVRLLISLSCCYVPYMLAHGYISHERAVAQLGEAPAVACSPAKGQRFGSRPGQQNPWSVSYYQTSLRQKTHRLAHELTTASQCMYMHSKCLLEVECMAHSAMLSYWLTATFIYHQLSGRPGNWREWRTSTTVSHFYSISFLRKPNRSLNDRWSESVGFCGVDESWVFIMMEENLHPHDTNSSRDQQKPTTISHCHTVNGQLHRHWPSVIDIDRKNPFVTVF